MQLLTLKDAQEIKGPIIYGLCSADDGVIRYVGRTVNPAKRLQAYFNQKKRGNYRLVTWLYKIGESLRFVVLKVNPPNLNKSELFFINKFKSQILNIDLTNTRYKISESAPWYSGRRILCPSALLMLYLRNRKAENPYLILTKEAIQKMTIKQRCRYENKLAEQFKEHIKLGVKIRAWQEATHKTMTKVLGNG